MGRVARVTREELNSVPRTMNEPGAGRRHTDVPTNSDPTSELDLWGYYQKQGEAADSIYYVTSAKIQRIILGISPI